MPLYTHAIVREVPDAYAECLTLEAIEVPIDVPKAREQHAHFCAILAGLGLEVTRLEADESLPDCCFIEDTAVLVDDLAILTNPGAPSRIKEVEAVEQALRGIKPLAKILPPGTLDGGDVLVIGKTIYIGQSTRTNEAGIRQFAALVEPNGYTVVSVPVSGLLHLKSAVTYLGNGQVILAPAYVDPSYFKEYHLLKLSEAEAYCANCLNVNGTILMPEGYEQVKKQIENLGFPVIELDMSEFKKGDGALTCKALLY